MMTILKTVIAAVHTLLSMCRSVDISRTKEQAGVKISIDNHISSPCLRIDTRFATLLTAFLENFDALCTHCKSKPAHTVPNVTFRRQIPDAL
jgi:hypothetical protein